MKPFVVFYLAFIFFFFCFIYFIISLFSVLVALGLCCLEKAYFSCRERAGAPLHHKASPCGGFSCGALEKCCRSAGSVSCSRRVQ